MWHEVEQRARDLRIVGQPLRALHRFRDVGDHAVEPPANFVAEEAQSAGAFRHAHLEARVVEVARLAARDAGGEPLEDAPARAYDRPPAPSGSEY
jgi:hypothetical protein